MVDVLHNLVRSRCHNNPDQRLIVYVTNLYVVLWYTLTQIMAFLGSVVPQYVHKLLLERHRV